MKKPIRPTFYDKIFFLRFLIVWYIIFLFMILIDGTMNFLDSFLAIVFGGSMFAVITYPINHLFRVTLYRFRKGELTLKLYLKYFLKWLIVFLIIWPILFFLLFFIVGIISIIISIPILFFSIDIFNAIGNILYTIFFPKDTISFWPLLPWRYFWITLIISLILAELRRNKIPKKPEKEGISCTCDYCGEDFIRSKTSHLPIFYTDGHRYSYHQQCYKNVLDKVPHYWREYVGKLRYGELMEESNVSTVNGRPHYWREYVGKRKHEEEKETTEKEPSTFYAKPKEQRTKSYAPEDKTQSFSDGKQKEIEEFFDALQRKKKSIAHYIFGVILNDANYNIFYSFINESKESLNILCWRIDEKLLSEMLWFLKDKNINVKIITKNRTNKGYLTEFKKHCSNLKLDTIHRNKIHAKIIIKDDGELILGSSNFTEASMSESGHFLDCNVITKHRETIESAIDLFKSLIHNKDYTKEIQNSKLMYSRNHKDYLPFSLKTYFEKESEEITLLFSCNQVDKRIIDRIIEWNSKTAIKLYVSDNWATSDLSNDNLNSMKWLYEASIKNYKNVNVIPVTADVHSKLYLFKNQNTAFISSQNLTVESWQSLLEAGILTDDKKDLKYLYDSINSLKNPN